jgi:DNA-binding transcriptional ArsR family regulator
MSQLSAGVERVASAKTSPGFSIFPDLQLQIGAGDEDLEQLTSLFRLLSDKTRLSILMFLARGERNVSSLCTAMRAPQPTISHHLGLLRTSNILTSRRRGKKVYYAIGSGTSQPDGSLELRVDRFRINLAPMLINPA